MTTQYEIDLALMAGYAYQTTRKTVNQFPAPPGWTVFYHATDATFGSTSGFEAVSFKRGSEIVISFAGTYDRSPNDLSTDANLYGGLGDRQLNEAVRYYLEVKKANPGATITFTGHSLGGGLAALMGVYFDRPAVTFDPAPFAKSLSTGVRDGIVNYFYGLGYSYTDVSTQMPELRAFSPEVVAARLANISGQYVQGEFLHVKLTTGYIGALTQIPHGSDADTSGGDLHSQALLSAFLLNNTFRSITGKLPDLLKMAFNTDLYASRTDTARENFTERLVRHQVGVADSFSPDNMLNRFTADMQKLTQEGGLTLTNENVSKALVAFAMQKYYEEKPGDSDAGQKLFTDVSGGIRFDRTVVADQLGTAKGYNLYFQKYLESLPAAEQIVIKSRLPLATDWFVQAGGTSLGATADNQRAFMLGGIGNDVLTGGTAADLLVGNLGNDTLDGGMGPDALLGGVGTDTYNFNGTWGKDTVLDSDGQGSIKIDGKALSTAKGAGERNKWTADLGGGVTTTLTVMDDSRSSTGKTLLITKGADTANNITINNFNLIKARSPEGYLGIKLEPTRLAVVEGVCSNVFASASFDPSSLVGRSSTVIEGNCETFTVCLDQAASSGETLSLALSADADKYQVILGDRTVSANGAVITLAEGQTEVVFALVQTGEVTGDSSMQLSAKFTSADGTATSNAWAVNLHDTGTPTHTYLGDQHGPTRADGSYDWGATSWAADGTLTGGVTEGNFADVIDGSEGIDKIEGKGGNDALDGGDGNDQIDGGDGDDLIGGGAGSDVIKGGAGNDYILSSATLGVQQRHKTTDSWSPPQGTTAITQGPGWGVYKDATGAIMWEGTNAPTGSDPDTIDGGAGNDWIIASAGDDHAQGGADDDTVFGMGGNDVLEGGDGKDSIHGDGIIPSGSATSLAALKHGADFIDGGLGDDTLTGDGGSDMLYGGADNDTLYGDSGGNTASADYVALAYHGNDTLDGEDGDDYLEGGGKDDTLYGGSGNDKLWGDTTAANVASAADAALLWGSDTLDGEDGDDELVGGGKDDTLLGGSGSDKLWGDQDSTQLAGADNGKDYLDAGDGNDQLVGGGNDDTLLGGTGDDALWGDSSLNFVAAEFQGNDYLDGGDGKDQLTGGGNDDTLLGGKGDDTLFGDDNNASLPGSANGKDTLDGGEGNDQLVGGGNDDTLIGAAGDDLLQGDSNLSFVAAQFHGNDTLDGGDGNDTLYGDGGDDVLLGGAGNDAMDGGDGNDTLDGGEGTNLLKGGAGDDTYIIDSDDVTAQRDPQTGVALLGTAILDTQGNNSIRVDVLQGDIRTAVSVNSEDNFVLSWGGTASSGTGIVINQSSAGHASLAFADGTHTTVTRLINETLDTTVTASSSTVGATLLGGKRSDGLSAYGDGSVISGGLGDDTITLGGQSQTVQYTQGDGVDTLGGDGHGATVALQGAFSAADLQLEVDAQGQVSVRLTKEGSEPVQRINLAIDRNSLQQFKLVDHFSLDGGATLSFADLLARGVKLTGTGTGGTDEDTLSGTDANDVINAGPGKHLLLGGGGDDTYIIANSSTNRVDDSQGVNLVRLDGASAWSEVALAQPVEGSNDLVVTVGSGATASRVTLMDALLRADKFRMALGDGQTRSLGSFIAALQPLQVTGNYDSNVIMGSDLGNVVDGSGGDDQISGGAGSDWLVGGDGADVISGAGGDDVLFGGAGDDVFVIDAHMGLDQIFDYEGSNTVRFAAGVSPQSVVVERVDDGTDLRIRLDASNAVIVRRGLEGAVGTYTFADGTKWTYADLIDRLPSPNGKVFAGDDLDNRIDGSSGNDVLLGNRGNDVLLGHAGDDELRGGDDRDALTGGAGNDLLDGGADEDRFYFAKGDGVDRLIDSAQASTLVFGAGISLEDLSASRQSVDGVSYVRLAYTANDAVLIGPDVVLSGPAVEFADGSKWTMDEVFAQALAEARILPPYTVGDDTIYGYAGNDVLQGGAGFDHLLGGKGNDELDGGADDDQLEGGAGDDTYVMGTGGGQDTIVEVPGQHSTIRLAQGDQTALTYARMGRNLLVSNATLNTSFYIADFYAGTSSWTLKTAQGVELDLRALAAAGLKDRTPEQRREDFYKGLIAKTGPMDLGDGQTLAPDTDKRFTDADGNEFHYAFHRRRAQIQSNDAVINASADGSSVQRSSTFLRTKQVTRSYEVTDVTYTYSDTVTDGRVIRVPWFNGSLGVPPGYSTTLDSHGNLYLVEPSRKRTTITPHSNSHTVTETYSMDLYHTEVVGESVVEDVRGGDAANTINLSGSASKLVMADGGNDVVVRTDAGGHDSSDGPLFKLGDWVDGGVGDDQIRLGGGDDELSGSAGQDFLDGGAGADTYVVSADDDGWDTIYDSAATCVHVEFKAGWYGMLDKHLADELAQLMRNPERVYINEDYHMGTNIGPIDPATGKPLETNMISGDVEVTAANLNALLAIDLARPAEGQSYTHEWGLDRSLLVSAGLDRLISVAMGRPFVTYASEVGQSEILRPHFAFTDSNLSFGQDIVSDTVRFGVGISRADLHLSWGKVTQGGSDQDALLVSWGGSGGVKVVMPDVGGPPARVRHQTP